ncbi:MAG: DUF547 domain-containing protein [Vicinamibacteria bacterium]|nr:DUF547 domain-containing protein [Vicinamibacteria bacterium]
MILQSLLLSGLVSFAPAKTQGPVSPEASLHAPFTALLRDHVRNDLVDYDAFAQAPEFQKYLRALATVRLGSRSKDDQLAFWINAYNAYTIQLINQHEERESIRNINKFLGLVRGKGPWKEQIVRAAGRTLTLDDVEHKIIRVEFKEPRIHMALVCAAVSCPPLRSEAYEGSKLSEQLHDQTRTFLRERQVANRLDLGNQIIHLSPIFDWYRKDFGKSDAAILKFVAPYFEGVGERSAFAKGQLQIEFTDYDWSLNIQRPRETQ